MVEDIRHRQEHIQFLEDYITELTERIDEITGGRDFEKEIRALEYRLEVLNRSDNTLFDVRKRELQAHIKKLREEFAAIEPVVAELEEERVYYRQAQSEL